MNDVTEKGGRKKVGVEEQTEIRGAEGEREEDRERKTEREQRERKEGEKNQGAETQTDERMTTLKREREREYGKVGVRTKNETQQVRGANNDNKHGTSVRMKRRRTTHRRENKTHRVRRGRKQNTDGSA